MKLPGPTRRSVFRTLFGALLATLLAVSAVSAGEPTWHSRPQDAEAKARETGRYILVDLYADWCGWCKVLERDVFATELFKGFAEDFVLLRVDVEDRGAGSRLQSTYEVSSLPTMLVLDAGGIQVGSLTGFFPASQYVERLRRAVQQYEASLQSFEQVRAKGDSAALRNLAETLHRRRDGKRAAALYDRLLAQDQTPTGRAMLLTMASDAQRLAGDLDRARTSADNAIALAKELQQPVLAEQAELLKAQIAQQAGDCDHAERSLVDFLRSHPKSPMRRQARDLLSSLRDTAACG